MLEAPKAIVLKIQVDHQALRRNGRPISTSRINKKVKCAIPHKADRHMHWQKLQTNRAERLPVAPNICSQATIVGTSLENFRL